MKEYRLERDSLGEVKVPAQALYGSQTQRAIENFPISGITLPRPMIRAFGLLKGACAQVNRDLGEVDGDIAQAISQAAAEVARGDHDEQFPVDIFQTGSGTSSNMNANEVIANRAIQILGGQLGSKRPVHPNDHVNRGQSSNDVFPTVIHMAALEGVTKGLLPRLGEMVQELERLSGDFHDIVKIGRTHLQDAVPLRLGQEFSGYASQIQKSYHRVEAAGQGLSELALGGTAVGTGLNALPSFAPRVIALLSRQMDLPLVQAPNLFEALAARDAMVELSGSLRTLAMGLIKVAEDIRWLGSGPRCGLGELRLPELQPGSSIMPGKVNPVICEMMLMVCAQVQGNDLAIALGGQGGHFELNTMMPLMAHNLLQSLEILTRAVEAFSAKLLRGLRADKEHCEEMVEGSLAMVTALAPALGYDRAAAIAQKAYRTNRTVRVVAEEEGDIPPDRLAALLDPLAMAGG